MNVVLEAIQLRRVRIASMPPGKMIADGLTIASEENQFALIRGRERSRNQLDVPQMKIILISDTSASVTS
jgi:hypothetical protein